MSINQLVFGHQTSVVIQNPIDGTNLALTNITKFDSKQNTEKETSKPLNAKPIFAHTPNGWTGTITFDRVDASIDTFFANMEANYWNVGLTYNGNITVYITELTGQVTQWLYSSASMTLSDAGSYESQKKITMRIDFESADREKIT